MSDARGRFPETLTFDDVLLSPGYSEALPTRVDLRAWLAGDLWLDIAVLSAATVIQAELESLKTARQGENVDR